MHFFNFVFKNLIIMCLPIKMLFIIFYTDFESHFDTLTFLISFELLFEITY